jgi:hypothetical protein
MRSVTFAQLKQRTRERADMVNSQFVDDTELAAYINESVTDLHDLLITTYGPDYYLENYTFSLVNNQDTYPLPLDFYKLEGVDYKEGTDKYLTLKPFQFQERNRFNNSLIYDYSTDGMIRAKYRLIGNNIKFIPMPSGNAEIKIWYHPCATVFSADGDVFDGINGYEELVIVSAAIKMLAKEESDTSALTQRYLFLIEKIKDSAPNRDSGYPEKVADVRRNDLGSSRYGVEY